MSDSSNSEKKLDQLLTQIGNAPESVEFNQVIDVIHACYDYTPTRFTNGKNDSTVINEAGSNEGSCKIFSFAQLQKLDKEKTLNCFGDYYRKDVLQNPDGSDHGNIRNFIRSGWAGISFDGQALKIKSSD